jgi:hypothetical protein
MLNRGARQVNDAQQRLRQLRIGDLRAFILQGRQKRLQLQSATEKLAARTPMKNDAAPNLTVIDNETETVQDLRSRVERLRTGVDSHDQDIKRVLGAVCDKQGRLQVDLNEFSLLLPEALTCSLYKSALRRTNGKGNSGQHKSNIALLPDFVRRQSSAPPGSTWRRQGRIDQHVRYDFNESMLRTYEHWLEDNPLDDTQVNRRMKAASGTLTTLVPGKRPISSLDPGVIDETLAPKAVTHYVTLAKRLIRQLEAAVAPVSPNPLAGADALGKIKLQVPQTGGQDSKGLESSRGFVTWAQMGLANFRLSYRGGRGQASRPTGTARIGIRDHKLGRKENIATLKRAADFLKMYRLTHPDDPRSDNYLGKQLIEYSHALEDIERQTLSAEMIGNPAIVSDGALATLLQIWRVPATSNCPGDRATLRKHAAEGTLSVSLSNRMHLPPDVLQHLGGRLTIPPEFFDDQAIVPDHALSAILDVYGLQAAPNPDGDRAELQSRAARNELAVETWDRFWSLPPFVRGALFPGGDAKVNRRRNALVFVDQLDIPGSSGATRYRPRNTANSTLAQRPAPTDLVRWLLNRAVRHLERHWVSGRNISLKVVAEDLDQSLKLRNDILGSAPSATTKLGWNAMIKWVKAQKGIPNEGPGLQIHASLLQAFCQAFGDDSNAEALRTAQQFLVAIEADRELCPHPYAVPLVSALARSPRWRDFEGEVRRALPDVSDVEMRHMKRFHDWSRAYLGMDQEVAESA